jgi:hypothetical protein
MISIDSSIYNRIVDLLAVYVKNWDRTLDGYDQLPVFEKA